MEKIIFNIWKNDDFCRITASDCRTKIRELADGACIFDMNVFLHEIEYITKECEKLNYTAVFQLAN